MALNNLKLISNNIYQRFVDPLIWKQKSNRSESTDDNRESMAFKDLMIKLEPHFVSIQSLLIWEKPYLSAIAFIAFNCLFCFIVCLSRRFYSFVAIILFCVNFYKLWSNYIWPEIRVPPNESTDTEGWTPIHPQVLSAPEISHYINEFFVMFNAFIRWFINLRQTNRGLFCLLTSTILLMTAIIGKLIPGVIIVYSLMMTLALGPGIALYVIPESVYHTIRSFMISKLNDEDSEEISQENEPYLLRREFKSFELNPFDDSMRDDSSLQLLSDSQLDNAELDKELGIDASLDNDDDIKICSSNSSNSDRSESSSGGIHFINTYFSRNSSTDNIEDEFELISESEVQDSAKGSAYSRQTDI